MEILRTAASLKRMVASSRAEGQKIGFVPTMGALHAGHLSLVQTARHRTEVVVVSIFVNPLQFGPSEDLSRYPRNLEADAALLKKESVDFLFAPAVEEMLPEGSKTFVDVPELSKGLCGASRPGHFRGVATIVTKLFNLVEPDVAFFGEKDYQQLQVIRRLVKDLHFPIEIVGVPTLRDKDGLALSSRNVFLSAEERRSALRLPEILHEVARETQSGRHETAALIARVTAALKKDSRLAVEYVEIVDPERLTGLTTVGEEQKGVLAVAIRVGQTRLIDNIFLGRKSS